MKLRKKLARAAAGIMAAVLTFTEPVRFMGNVYEVQAGDRTEHTQASQTINSGTGVKVSYTQTSTITAGSWGTGSPAEDLAQVKFTVANGTSGTISDWEVTIKCTSNIQNYNSGWNGVSYSGDTLTIIPSSDVNNQTLNAGSSNDSAGCQIPLRFLTGATYTVTYYDGESQGSSSGSGTATSGGLSLSTFSGGNNIGSIDTAKDYNFAKLLQLSLYFYDANMCGDQVGERSYYSNTLYGGWRDDCHTSNDHFTYNGTQYDATGGYHDAGDHVKFGLPQAQAMSATPKFCSSCGAPIAGSKFCSNCGAPVQ